MFQSLRANNQFYVLHKDGAPRVEIGNVVSVSAPAPKFPMQMNYGQPQEMVVDVVVRMGEQTTTFQKLPAGSDIADFGPNGNIVVADSREAMNSELTAMRQKSYDIINSVDFHKSVIEGCDKTLRELNPEYAEKQQQQQEIADLIKQVEMMSKGMADMLAANRELIAQLKGESAPDGGTSRTRKQQQ